MGVAFAVQVEAFFAVLSPSLDFASFAVPAVCPGAGPDGMPAASVCDMDRIPLVGVLRCFYTEGAVRSGRLLKLLVVVLLPRFCLSGPRLAPICRAVIK